MSKFIITNRLKSLHNVNLTQSIIMQNELNAKEVPRQTITIRWKIEHQVRRNRNFFWTVNVQRAKIKSIKQAFE